MAAMRLLFFTTAPAAWNVQAGIVDLNAEAAVRRAVEHSIGGLCARKQNVIKHVE